jgi:hypothetical protein
MPQVIILAGGSISGKLSFLRSRCTSPALIPINTRPLSAYLLDFYVTQSNCSVHLCVNAEVAETVRLELGGFEGRYKLNTLEINSGVVDSLTLALREITADDYIIVNLVTTIPGQLVNVNEVLVAGQTTQSTLWSGVILQSEIPVFSFKSDHQSVASHAFTGVFGCSRTQLESALTTTNNRNDLLSVVEQLQLLQPLKYTKCEWIDCGHETNYYEAKSQLISSRSFNNVRVSLEDGVLKKSSQDTVKLKREIDFVKMLPPSIEVYFPRILSNSSNSVESEYYGYPTVAEYFLYWDLSTDNWRRLFSRIKGLLRRFKSFPYAIAKSAFDEFYLAKTKQRLMQYLSGLNPSLRKSLEGEIIINGRLCPPFVKILPVLESRLAEMYRDSDFCVMHGDFCFSNILYDIPSGVVRLIDPRGSFGDACIGIYGDQKYDLAKIKHSAEYGYDFLVNGLYTLNQFDNRLDYTLASRECSPFVSQLSRDLTLELGYADEEIRLLTALLFLSMCPLHNEDQSRQLVMFAHGMSLLNDCLGS